MKSPSRMKESSSSTTWKPPKRTSTPGIRWLLEHLASTPMLRLQVMSISLIARCQMSLSACIDQLIIPMPLWDSPGRWSSIFRRLRRMSLMRWGVLIRIFLWSVCCSQADHCWLITLLMSQQRLSQHGYQAPPAAKASSTPSSEITCSSPTAKPIRETPYRWTGPELWYDICYSLRKLWATSQCMERMILCPGLGIFRTE